MILCLALGICAAHFWQVKDGPLWGLLAGMLLALVVPAKGSCAVRGDAPDA